MNLRALRYDRSEYGTEYVYDEHDNPIVLRCFQYGTKLITYYNYKLVDGIPTETSQESIRYTSGQPDHNDPSYVSWVEGKIDALFELFGK